MQLLNFVKQTSMHYTTVHIDVAAQKAEQWRKEAQAEVDEQKEMLSLAIAEIWELLSLESFRGYSDIEDIASSYGVSEEDLIFGLI